MADYKAEFVKFAIASNVLCFGEFKTKAGRMSPYFFNAGLFNDGDTLKRLGEFYAKAIVDSGIAVDVLFGPAYKGIPLAASIAIALAGRSRWRVWVGMCHSRSIARRRRTTARVVWWSARRCKAVC